MPHLPSTQDRHRLVGLAGFAELAWLTLTGLLGSYLLLTILIPWDNYAEFVPGVAGAAGIVKSREPLLAVAFLLVGTLGIHLWQKWKVKLLPDPDWRRAWEQGGTVLALVILFDLIARYYSNDFRTDPGLIPWFLALGAVQLAYVLAGRLGGAEPEQLTRVLGIVVISAFVPALWNLMASRLGVVTAVGASGPAVVGLFGAALAGLLAFGSVRLSSLLLLLVQAPLCVGFLAAVPRSLSGPGFAHTWPVAEICWWIVLPLASLALIDLGRRCYLFLVHHEVSLISPPALAGLIVALAFSGPVLPRL